MSYSFEADYQSREDLRKYGSNALLMYALQLRFNIEDIDSVASESLTDGYEDKKCDLIYIDENEQVAVVAQAYMKQQVSSTDRAKLTKASDLNTAMAWIFGRKIDDIPKTIRSAVISLQDAISNEKITTLFIWYSHNCQESSEIKDELKTVEISAKNHLDGFLPKNNLKIHSQEVGNQTIEKWYQKTKNKILVTESISIPLKYGGFEVKSDKWKAFQAYIQGKQLYNLYKVYEDDLFSANPRRFLGLGKRTNIINMGIKKSAEKEPENFWVYNNGITALVHSYEVIDECLNIGGMSIINGAQTTGSLGSMLESPNEELFIPLRVIVCNDNNTIESIIDNNNKQNDMIPSDFRSNDQYQDSLRKAFKQYPNIYYSGGLRSNVRTRPREVFDPSIVGQVLMAFGGNPVDAYNSKQNIWIEDKLYSTIFNENLTAEHIIFVYSLSKAIDLKKTMLQSKKKNNNILEDEENQLSFLSRRGTRILLLSAIAKNLEIIIQKRINSSNRIVFRDNTDFAKCIKWWLPLIDIVLPLNIHMTSALSVGGLANKEKANEVINQVGAIISSIKTQLQVQGETFAEKILM